MVSVRATCLNRDARKSVLVECSSIVSHDRASGSWSLLHRPLSALPSAESPAGACTQHYPEALYGTNLDALNAPKRGTLMSRATFDTPNTQPARRRRIDGTHAWTRRRAPKNLTFIIAA